MKFTPEYIKRARMAALFLGEPACTEFREALDELTILQEENNKLQKIKNGLYLLLCEDKETRKLADRVIELLGK